MDELRKVVEEAEAQYYRDIHSSAWGLPEHVANAVRTYLESPEVVAEILRVFNGGVVYEPNPARPGGMAAYWKPTVAMRAALNAAGGRQ